MKLPNCENAIIEPSKLTEYLLNVEHKRGGNKARSLIQFGYSRENWQQLAVDIRQCHLEANVNTVRETSYGTHYEISEFLQTPSGRQLRVKTVWQIDRETDFPRLITLVSD